LKLKVKDIYNLEKKIETLDTTNNRTKEDITNFKKENKELKKELGRKKKTTETSTTSTNT
jgi:seryl-tRNA synthetase